jgi:hypothetical protein
MNIIERVKNILLNPKYEWEVIKDEVTTIQELFTSYAVILAAIPAAAGWIGYSFSGWLPVGSSFGWAIVTYILSLAGAFLVGYIIDAFAATFGSTKDLTASMKVSVYASTASWVGGIFNLFGFLSFLSLIAGIYTLVLMYFGLKIVKNVPDDKATGYFITVVVVSIVIYLIIGSITSALFLTSYAVSGM